MSKNHPDDNIYSILGKLKSLEPTPAEVIKEKAQSIRESVESRGSIVGGVSQVQARLAEQFATESEKWIQKTGVEKNKGGLHKALHVPQGETIPKSKIEKASHSKNAHLRHMAQFAKNVAHEDTEMAETADFGMNSESIEECTMCAEGSCTEHNMEEGKLVPVKGGHVHKGTYGYEIDPNSNAPKKKSATGQRGRPKAEKPAEYSKTNDLFGRVPDKAPKGKKGTVVKGKATVAESMNLIESRILLEANFKRMAEEHGMTMDECMATLNDHYNTYKTTGECSNFLRDCMDLRNHHKQLEMETVVPPSTAPVDPKPGMLDRAKQLGQKALDKFGHPDDEEMLKDLERKTHPTGIEEELNELARLAGLDVEEGNAFTGKLANTPNGEEFELDGKNYKDTSNLEEASCNECGMYESQCSCHEGNRFTKYLKDTPNGEEFEIDGKRYTDTSDLDEVMKLSGLPVKETVKVNEPDEKPVNAPKPEYKSMKQSTMNPGEGDFGEKNMYGGRGDNKMTQQPNRPTKPVAVKESTVELETRLAAEYESIKKVK